MNTPFGTPIQAQFSEAPLIGAVLIGLLVSAGWVMTDPKWTKSATGGIFGSSQNLLTMLIVFAIAAVLGFYGVKWWVES